jgi:hypothetical protein
MRALSRSVIEGALALAPWLASMYVFYWLESTRTWTPETPHRGKLSVALLGGGMILSFLVRTYLSQRRRKRPALR